MPVVMFQVLLIIASIFLCYGFINYLRSSERKLKRAKKKKEFFLIDDQENVQKNLTFVYKGCSFIGEKYIGSQEERFVVANIHISVVDPLELRGISKKDLIFLEEKIKSHYPYATIHWRHPIQLLFKES